MGLFSVVQLEKSKLVTVGVRPLREGETPVMAATAGRIMELAQEEPENSSPVALQVTPVQSVPQSREQSPEAVASHTDTSNSVQILERGDWPRREAKGGVWW